MTEERKHTDPAPDDNATDAARRRSEADRKLSEKKPKLGDTIEGEGSPGLSIGGGGHA